MSKKLVVTFVLTIAVGIAASFTHAADDEWIVDYEAAKKLAEKSNKDILMNFTGSDWCPYCIKLDNSVLSADEFKKEIPKHYVLLKLDFPHNTSKQTEKEIKQNQQLNKKFQIAGYPTVLMVDVKGRPIAKLEGYDGTAAKDYVTQLVDYKKARVQRDDFLAKAAKVKGVEKAKWLDQAVSQLDTDLVIASYRDEIDQIITLDSEDTAGLKSKYKNLLRLPDVKQKIIEIQNQNTDPKAALEALDKLIADLKPTGSVAAELYYNRSYCKYALQDLIGARADLEAALKADPQTPHAEDIRDIMKNLFNPEKSKDQEEKS